MYSGEKDACDVTLSVIIIRKLAFQKTKGETNFF
jgi:hypothetical protein